jgi:hypothetical protein
MLFTHVAQNTEHNVLPSIGSNNNAKSKGTAHYGHQHWQLVCLIGKSEFTSPLYLLRDSEVWKYK